MQATIAAREAGGVGRSPLSKAAAYRPAWATKMSVLLTVPQVNPGGNRGPGPSGPGTGGAAQAVTSLVSWLEILSLRGLAASCTGMLKVSTPAV